MPYLAKLPLAPLPSSADWQKDMQTAFRRLDVLLAYLDLDPTLASIPLLTDSEFPILVPRSFADRMVKGDWNDPLLQQVLPLEEEVAPVVGFRDDAVGDLASQILPGLLHKYASRALLMVSPQCAIHCRYCFRREFPYGDLPRGQAGWDEAWEYLRSAQGIDEIVFSGGDPLFLDNRRLASLLEHALALPAIRTLRFHTRLPVVLPSRIEPHLLELLRAAAEKKSLIIVIHANHPNEIDGECLEALAALRSIGALLLNQAVLLKGVNDQVEPLAELSRRLIQYGVLPYYLHQLDRVTGTAHFEVAEKRGRELIEELQALLPGYAVPKYVREIAGEAHKTPLL